MAHRHLVVRNWAGMKMRPEKFTTQMIRESEDFAAFRSQGAKYFDLLVDTFNALKARRSKYVTMLSDPDCNRGELIEKFYNATFAMQELIEMSGGRIKFQI